MAPRLRHLYDGIVEVLEQFKPSVVVVEQLFAHYDHPRTAILMAHARGVMFLAAAQRGLPVVSYNATRIKKTVTGNGRAPRSRCSGPSSASWDWPSCRSRPTWPTPWPPPCAITMSSNCRPSEPGSVKRPEGRHDYQNHRRAQPRAR